MPSRLQGGITTSNGADFVAKSTYKKSHSQEIALVKRLGNFRYRFENQTKEIKTKILIRNKWLIDSLFLPLERTHFELYEIIHRVQLQQLGHLPRLVNCKDFNDHIQWLKLFDQSEDVILCSDKLGVRSYVEKKLGHKYLPKVFQIRDSFDEIVFDELPESFVIKANHDSGTVLLVKSKSKCDQRKAKEYFDNALSRNFGLQYGEWAYSCIKPKVFIEEYIQPDADAPPADYKFQCVEGKVKFCRYTYDRGMDTKEIVLDSCGQNMGFIIDEHFKPGFAFHTPENWGEMVCVAEKLSRDFKAVRIDMYNVDGQIFIGEFTFFPYFGAYKGEGQKKVGCLMNFNRKSFKPPIYKKYRIDF
jgi:hypothetical protein